jgi:hypothetical protein
MYSLESKIINFNKIVHYKETFVICLKIYDPDFMKLEQNPRYFLYLETERREDKRSKKMNFRIQLTGFSRKDIFKKG